MAAVQLPGELKPGQGIPKKAIPWLNKLRKFVWATHPIGNNVIEGRDGSFIRTSTADATTPVQPRPFHLYDASQSVNGAIVALQVGIVYGTVAGFIPTGMAAGLDAIANVGATSGFVYVAVSVGSGGAATAVSLKTGSSVPTNTDSTAYLQIGTFDGTSGKGVNTADNLSGSQAYQKCGSTHLFGLI